MFRGKRRAVCSSRAATECSQPESRTNVTGLFQLLYIPVMP